MVRSPLGFCWHASSAGIKLISMSFSLAFRLPDHFHLLPCHSIDSFTLARSKKESLSLLSLSLDHSKLVWAEASARALLRKTFSLSFSASGMEGN